MAADEITDAAGRVWRRHGPQCEPDAEVYTDWWIHHDNAGRTTYRTAAALQTELRKAAREAKP